MEGKILFISFILSENHGKISEQKDMCLHKTDISLEIYLDIWDRQGSETVLCCWSKDNFRRRTLL